MNEILRSPLKQASNSLSVRLGTKSYGIAWALIYTGHTLDTLTFDLQRLEWLRRSQDRDPHGNERAFGGVEVPMTEN